ncbi:MAG: 6-phosphogluconolactonase [Acidobacteriota bacterium]|nr:6-phosphogluconolactonase [Acidobacteriota bacterium]
MAETALPLRSFATPGEVAIAAADYVVQVARTALAQRGTFHVAFSGGRTPELMFAELAERDLDWSTTTIYQVDERIVAEDDPARNLRSLAAAFAARGPRIVAMGVTDANLLEAARRYGEALPARLDLVHLGLGADGHTASLVPGDPVLDVDDELVAITRPYQGHARMTLTYPALARADEILWLVTGREKRDALARLRRADVTIPAGRVVAPRALVMVDEAAL